MSETKKRVNDSELEVVVKKKKTLDETKPSLNSFSYADLPNEILFKIFDNLNLKELCKTAR